LKRFEEVFVCCERSSMGGSQTKEETETEREVIEGSPGFVGTSETKEETETEREVIEVSPDFVAREIERVRGGPLIQEEVFHRQASERAKELAQRVGLAKLVERCVDEERLALQCLKEGDALKCVSLVDNFDKCSKS
jgi:hypothetical protein